MIMHKWRSNYNLHNFVHKKSKFVNIQWQKIQINGFFDK